MYKTILYLSFIVILGLANVNELKAENVTVGGYTISLDRMWRIENDPPVLPGKIAVRMEDKGMYSVQIGEMLAAELIGSMQKESSELIASAKQDKKVFRVINTGIFNFENGTRGKFVILLMNASAANYKSPMIFYSVYIPKNDGSSVTFKLKCSEPDFDYLRGEFDQIISKASKE